MPREGKSVYVSDECWSTAPQASLRGWHVSCRVAHAGSHGKSLRARQTFWKLSAVRLAEQSAEGPRGPFLQPYARKAHPQGQRLESRLHQGGDQSQ